MLLLNKVVHFEESWLLDIEQSQGGQMPASSLPALADCQVNGTARMACCYLVVLEVIEKLFLQQLYKYKSGIRLPQQRGGDVGSLTSRSSEAICVGNLYKLTLLGSGSSAPSIAVTLSFQDCAVETQLQTSSPN